MKISKLLPITLAMMLGMSGAFAAPVNTDKANYDLTLPEFFNVKATAPTASPVTFDDNYTVGTIKTTLSGNFHVISNTNTKDVYIYATCPTSDDGDVAALYGADASSLKLIFTNTGQDALGAAAGTEALGATVEGMRKVGGAAAKDSPNAVAFNLTVKPTMVANSYPAGATIAEGTVDDNNLKFTIPNCKVDFACDVNGTTQDNSFSTLDTNGLYRATLYLSTTGQTL